MSDTEVLALLILLSRSLICFVISGCLLPLSESITTCILASSSAQALALPTRSAKSF
jgi:hypothetical protein